MAVPPPNRTHVVEDQKAVFRFLERPETHGIDGPVKRIDTHGAAVFLAGSQAYKVKRAVLFPFMDFSTLAKRRRACLTEVEINGPGAPGLYLGAVPIARSASGLALGGDGEAVEWAVHMRRFDENQTLDHVADRGELTTAMLADVVRAALALHRRAPLREGRRATDGLASYLRQNREAFAENADLFPPGRANALVDASQAELERLRPLLEERGRLGLVRRCHGDLHLRNVVLIEGRPTLFDAIEFDDGIATCDVLYDLAFLVMDLWERGLRREANLVLNRYLWAADEANLSGVAAVPLFVSIRATIRAKVIAAAIPSMAEEARPSARADAARYFDLAEEALAPAAPRLLAIGGLSGSGKSTVGSHVAPALGRVPGAVHLRSDIVRKRLASVAETERLPPRSYTAARSLEVYAALRRQAAAVLAAGSSVVADAVHARKDERAAIEAIARECGVPFDGIWLDAPLETLARRIEGRTNDASDASVEVLRRQAGYELGSLDWTRIDAGGEPERIAAALLDQIGTARR